MSDPLMTYAEIMRRTRAPRFRLEDFLFKEQLDFVRDPEPFKDAVCTRRSGKTVACAADLIDTTETHKEVTSLYVTLSRVNAKRIIWPELKKINRVFNLNLVPNESELSLYSPKNGSTIYLAGASDKTEIEKFRGLPLKKVYIDESQSFPSYIRELIDDVISPALMDFAGSLNLIGTPGPIPAGFFFDCSHSDSWSHHQWSFFQNPFISQKSGMTHQALLDRELKRRGVTIDDPSIQREWFGKWVLDSNSLVFKYSKELNHYDNLPARHFTYILGVDLGFDDSDALSVLAWSDDSPTTYLVEEIVRPKQGITELVEQIEGLRRRYDFGRIVADFGGLGKKIAEEIIRRHSLHLVAADKARKNEAIEFLNDAMRTQRFMAKRTSRFASDCMLVEWDADKTTPERRVVSDRFHSDIIDATLYAFRESPAYSYQPPPPRPQIGSPEWAKEQVDEMEKQTEERLKNTYGEDDWGF